MRSQQQLPEDPTAHFMDYVGNQRSPLWDDMETMEDENEKMGQELPSLESEISRLMTQVAEAQRKSRVLACYKTADPEATVSHPITTNNYFRFEREMYSDRLIDFVFLLYRMLSQRKLSWPNSAASLSSSSTLNSLLINSELLSTLSAHKTSLSQRKNSLN